MDQEPTVPQDDATPLERIEAMLSADTPSVQNEEKPEADTPTEGQPADVVEAETPEYQLADMAKLLGADESALDVDEDGSLLIKTKIDGVESRAKFADLLKNYQIKGHAENTAREAAEIRKAAIEQAQAIQQQIQVQQSVIQHLAEVKAIEAEYAQYKGVNLDALIDSDPVQALKVQRHMQALQERHAQASQMVQQAASYVQNQQAQHHEATLESERQALIKALPEWQDEAAANKEKAAIVADLKARGYSERDIKTLSDHKAVLLARDAMLYRAMKSTNATTEKQLRSAPKIIKPGSTQSASRLNAVQKAKQEVRQTGSRDSVARYLLAAGKV